MKTKSQKAGQYLFLLPAIVVVIFAEILPVFYTTYLGFTHWNLITSPKWAGLTNYIQVFSDPTLLNALKNTFVWVATTLVFPVGLALIIARLLTTIRMQPIFKTLFFIPTAFSPTIAGIFWRRVLSSQKGAVMSIVEGLGHQSFPILTNPTINTYPMLLVWTWQFLGLNLVLFLVGFETIPRELEESAQLDGASAFQVFRNVQIPLIRPILMLVVANAVINSMRMFDIPWVMTGGGPGRASETLAVSLYRESFFVFKMGLGSAIGVVISILTLGFSFNYLLSTRRRSLR